jgi:hypothetical protein
MEQPLVDFTQEERLVVFDFDNTLYMHSYFNKPNSCRLNKCSRFEFNLDPAFIEASINKLIERGINVGIASFGKKSVIIDCLNNLLGKEYFNKYNVITVSNLEDEWKKQLAKISRTYKSYLDRFEDEDEAFKQFLIKERPDKISKCFCLKLPSSAKYEMINLIRQYYESLIGTEIIENHDIRYFDDDKENIDYALEQGIMAHHVPLPGFTESWWLQECKKFEIC